MMTRFTCLIALLTLTLATGCKTKTSAPDTPPDTLDPAPDAASKVDITALVARVETLRDRQLATPLNMQLHDTIPAELLRATPLPAPVATAYKALAAHLDAEVLPEEALELPAPAHHTLALYDPATHTLHHVPRPEGDDVRWHGAIARAVVHAIDSQPGARASSVDSIDGWLAARAVSDGDAMFVALVHALDGQVEHEVSAGALALSPEIMWSQPQAATLLGESFYGHENLVMATHSFAPREGANFIAAMVRAHGWSGAEVAASMPPTSTAGLIDPARWIKGGQDATWTLPEAWEAAQRDAGWSPAHAGQAGAAWTTMWLARARSMAFVGVTSPDDLSAAQRTLGDMSDQALQVIPASWRADRWQTSTREGFTQLLWTSQWEVPTSASYVSRMIAAGIEAMHARQPNLSMRCGVADEGIQVAVLCSDDPARGKAWLEEHSAMLARKARVSYSTAQDVPLQFKPSTTQRLLQSAREMTIDDELRWRDPGLGLGADLSALQLYSPQTTPSGLIRWYGVYDGATIQLTAEPTNPLEPEFSSKAYAESLSTKILATLPEGKKLGGQAVTHPTLGAAHALSFGATFEGIPHQIHLWHMSHGDEVLTLSINAPEASAKSSRELAATIFAQLGELR